VLFSKENVVNGLLGKMISFQKMCAIWTLNLFFPYLGLMVQN
jgi:hypothetical protein